MAAAWFVLAADFEHMVTVLVDKRYMANIDLGLAVFRYLRDTMSDSLVKLTQLSSTFVITPDHLTSMERVLLTPQSRSMLSQKIQRTLGAYLRKSIQLSIWKSLRYQGCRTRCHQAEFTKHH